VVNRLAAIQKCFDLWGPSSPGLVAKRSALAGLLAAHCAADFSSESYGYGVISRVKELAKASNIPEPDAALLAAECLTRQKDQPDAAVWFCLASLVAPATGSGVVVEALGRLLDGELGGLARHVDGKPSQVALESVDDAISIVAGLIWLRLGANDAMSRWRAAHSVRMLVRLERWRELDRLVDSYLQTDAGVFASNKASVFLFARTRLASGRTCPSK